ncbi:MAG TPA: PASTA domain-containing protein, partial [Gaiellaceae bacterium]|nr:PASTA domain-containing protein [Gaiellaceae bacterium]
PPAPPRPTCAVPRLIGMTLETARTRIEGARCSVGRVRRGRSIKRRIGKVIGQAPRAGALRRIGAPVSIAVGRR